MYHVNYIDENGDLQSYPINGTLDDARQLKFDIENDTLDITNVKIYESKEVS